MLGINRYGIVEEKDSYEINFFFDIFSYEKMFMLNS